MHTIALLRITDILFALSAFYNTYIYIPQIIRLLEIKKSEEISVSLFLLFIVTQLLQIADVYMSGKEYAYIIGASVVTTALGVTTFLLIYYRAKQWLQLFNRTSAEKTTKNKVIFVTKQVLNKMTIVNKIFAITFFILLVSGIYLTTKSDFKLVRDIIAILLDTLYIVVAFTFIIQIITLLKIKHADEFSLTTFAGFNLIQVVVSLYAYYHHLPNLLFGMLLYLITSGVLTGLIIYYKKINHEF